MTRPMSAIAKCSGQRSNQKSQRSASHTVLIEVRRAIKKLQHSAQGLGNRGREIVFIVGRNPETNVLCVRTHQSFVPWKYR